MSSLLENVISKAGSATEGAEPIKLDAEGQPPLVARSQDANFELKSTTPMPTIESPSAAADNLKGLPTAAQNETDDEAITDLMAEVDPTDVRLFKQPRYYAQTGQRRGFMYTYRNYEGVDTTLRFEQGVYVTHDRALCKALDADIKRAMGIAPYIMNITVANYKELMRNANSFLKMRSGMNSSSDGDAHKLQREQNEKNMRDLIDKQVAEIDKLKAEIAKQGGAGAPTTIKGTDHVYREERDTANAAVGQVAATRLPEAAANSVFGKLAQDAE